MSNESLEFACKNTARVVAVRGPAGVAEPYLFKISQKRQSSSQSERASIPATRCLGSIGHLFLCSLFSTAFSSPRAWRGRPCTHSVKPKKAPARFLNRVSQRCIYFGARGISISSDLYHSCFELSTTSI